MYESILGPLDGSKLSECSLEHIKAIATGCKASKVTLLTVIEELQPVFMESAGQQLIENMAKQREQEAKEIQKRAEGYLAKIAGGFEKEGIAVETAVIHPSLAHGVANAILEYTQNNKVDLIIMGTHGRSGISRWAFGSVADKVIRDAKVPVLTVTPAGCRI